MIPILQIRHLNDVFWMIYSFNLTFWWHNRFSPLCFSSQSDVLLSCGDESALCALLKHGQIRKSQVHERVVTQITITQLRWLS